MTTAPESHRTLVRDCRTGLGDRCTLIVDTRDGELLLSLDGTMAHTVLVPPQRVAVLRQAIDDAT